MKINLATILLIALSTVGVISLTSSNLSSASQQGNYRGTTYLSKDMKILQITHNFSGTGIWETAFQVPTDGNGSTWEVSDFISSKETINGSGTPLGYAENYSVFWRIMRSTGEYEALNKTSNMVHHRGIVLHEGDSLEVLNRYQIIGGPNNAFIKAFASGKYIN